MSREILSFHIRYPTTSDAERLTPARQWTSTGPELSVITLTKAGRSAPPIVREVAALEAELVYVMQRTAGRIASAEILACKKNLSETISEEKGIWKVSAEALIDLGGSWMEGENDVRMFKPEWFQQDTNGKWKRKKEFPAPTHGRLITLALKVERWVQMGRKDTDGAISHYLIKTYFPLIVSVFLFDTPLMSVTPTFLQYFLGA